MSSKAWCFTINNVQLIYQLAQETNPATHFPEAFVGWLEFPEQRDAYSYLCFQLETAPSTGNLHAQGYIYLRSSQRLGWVKRFIGRYGLHTDLARDLNPHVERSRGTPQQNRAYCSKCDTGLPDTFRELGTLPRQGNRSDLAELTDAIIEGNDLNTIASTFPTEFVKYNKGIQALRHTLLAKPRNPAEETTVLWWFGPTGTGKSRRAFESYPDAYIKMPNNKWWDGYEFHSTVILDDYRPSMCPFHELLRLLDRYPMKVEYKGGTSELQARTFVITTCERPELLWQDKTTEKIDQLIRRITEIRQFKTDGTTTILKDSATTYVKAPTDGSLVTTFNPYHEPF